MRPVVCCYTIEVSNSGSAAAALLFLFFLKVEKEKGLLLESDWPTPPLPPLTPAGLLGSYALGEGEFLARLFEKESDSSCAWGEFGVGSLNDALLKKVNPKCNKEWTVIKGQQNALCLNIRNILHYIRKAISIVFIQSNLKDRAYQNHKTISSSKFWSPYCRGRDGRFYEKV